jgi:hypothetical protein
MSQNVPACVFGAVEFFRCGRHFFLDEAIVKCVKVGHETDKYAVIVVISVMQGPKETMITSRISDMSVKVRLHLCVLRSWYLAYSGARYIFMSVRSFARCNYRLG